MDFVSDFVFLFRSGFIQHPSAPPVCTSDSGMKVNAEMRGIQSRGFSQHGAGEGSGDGRSTWEGGRRAIPPRLREALKGRRGEEDGGIQRLPSWSLCPLSGPQGHHEWHMCKLGRGTRFHWGRVGRRPVEVGAPQPKDKAGQTGWWLDFGP